MSDHPLDCLGGVRVGIVDEDRERYVEDVLVAVEAIPSGKVATYGDIAAYVGRGGPRQVGAVMREHGAAVAWWRVLRASGIPAEGLARKQLVHLLDEGISATNGRVDLRAHRWTPGGLTGSNTLP